MTGKERRRQALESQVRRLRGRLEMQQRHSQRLSHLRLGLFLLGVAASAATLLSSGVWWWLGVSLLVAAPFFTAVYTHLQVGKTIQRYKIWLDIKEKHLARMALDWERLPAAEPVPPRFDHPFALDLDLIGERSLHQLLDTAVSQEGSERLRDWLLEPAPDPSQIATRQALVQELAYRPLFRDKLRLHAALVAQDAEQKWPGQRLLTWLADQPELPSLRAALLFLAPLAVVNMILWVLSINGLLPSWWGATWLIFVFVSLLQMRRIGPVFNEVFFLRDGLEQLQVLFGFLEGYRYGRSPNLTTLCHPFVDGNGRHAGQRPSNHLKRIQRIVGAISLQKNPFLWISLNAVIPWDIYFVYQLNRAKESLAELLPAWLDIWFELEALNSLANYAYLNPDNTFPIIQTDQTTLLQASQVGHPLIPDENRICNDFVNSKPGSIDIITGSNMSGKSSFLRTLGINLRLAYAGGPVLAQAFSTALFRMYSSIRITDSVTDGFSYFYAEVQRLQALLQELERDNAIPLFFLIDEIFRGTNNRERLIGSRAYIRALSGKNGIGIVATHDLELVQLAEELSGVSNFHFRDDVRNGRMTFDYKLRPGPCPTTNALKIMELAGLPIPPMPLDPPTHS